MQHIFKPSSYAFPLLWLAPLATFHLLSNCHDCNALESEQDTIIQSLERVGAEVRKVKAKTKGSTPRSKLVLTVIIGPKWKGQDSDIQHLKRLSDLSQLIVAGKGRVPEKALEQLQLDLPKLRIMRATDAFLGIQCGKHPKGVLVSQTLPKYSADRAGLKKNDVITEFNGQPVRDLKALLKLLWPHHPKDEVTLTILRGRENVEVKVVLDPLPYYVR